MSITITIDGEGLSLKKETTLQKAGQIIAFLGLEEGSLGTVPSGETSHKPASLIPSPIFSPIDMISEAKAKTNAQKITVLGKYLSDKDGPDGFLIKEILLQLRKIGEEPGNFTRDLKNAVSLQYIYVIDAKEGKYGISAKGATAIQNKFADEPRKPSVKGRGGFKKAIPVRAEVTSLQMVSTLSGYPDFHTLPTKADSILWVLAYADGQKIADLTPKEVEEITDKLCNKLEQKAFSAHNKRNIKSGYVAQTDGKFKIQQKGLDHLKSLSTKGKHDKE